MMRTLWYLLLLSSCYSVRRAFRNDSDSSTNAADTPSFPTIPASRTIGPNARICSKVILFAGSELIIPLIVEIRTVDTSGTASC